MSKPKPVKLRAFTIENNDIKNKDSDLLEVLSTKLENVNAKDRKMLLNADDPNKEEDLISDYTYSVDNKLYGAILRVMDSSQSVSIPDSLFNGQKIPITELDSLELEESQVYKDHYYFMINKNYLVTNLRGNYTVKRFQTYINWLLEKERGESLYEFTPKTKIPPNFTIKELRNIKVSTPEIHAEEKKSSSTGLSSKKIADISSELVKNFLKDVKSFSDIQAEKIISAELLIKFKKPKTMAKEKYEEILGAYMKPISDVENVTFTPKKGRPIKGSEILCEKIVDIEITESGKLSEPELFQAMEGYLTELKND